ncbi:E3 ubiquitin ligase [Savitreella phatthalungensis]
MRDWLPNNKRCPTCRQPIKRSPSSAFLLRDLSDAIVDHIERLDPHGEGHELRRAQQEQRNVAARKVCTDTFETLFAQDRNASSSHRPGGGLGLFYDATDDVLRCSNCQWEAEDGLICAQCGEDFPLPLSPDIMSDQFEHLIAEVGGLSRYRAMLGLSESDLHDNGDAGGVGFGESSASADDGEDDVHDAIENEYDLEDSFIDNRNTSEVDVDLDDTYDFDEEDDFYDHDSDEISEVDEHEDTPESCDQSFECNHVAPQQAPSTTETIDLSSQDSDAQQIQAWDDNEAPSNNIFPFAGPRAFSGSDALGGQATRTRGQKRRRIIVVDTDDEDDDDDD